VGAFVVYDVTDPNSLEHCSQWKKEIDDTVQLENGDPIPVVLMANKVIFSIILTCMASLIHAWCLNVTNTCDTGGLW